MPSLGVVTTTFTCGQCGEQRTLDGAWENDCPVGWATVEIHRRMCSLKDSPALARWHRDADILLCVNCFLEVLKFLETKPKRA